MNAPNNIEEIIRDQLSGRVVALKRDQAALNTRMKELEVVVERYKRVKEMNTEVTKAIGNLEKAIAALNK